MTRLEGLPECIQLCANYDLSDRRNTTHVPNQYATSPCQDVISLKICAYERCEKWNTSDVNGFLSRFCASHSEFLRRDVAGNPPPSTISTTWIIFTPLIIHAAMAIMLLLYFKSFLKGSSLLFRAMETSTSWAAKIFYTFGWSDPPCQVLATLGLLRSFAALLSFLVYFVNINQTLLYSSIQGYILILEAVEFATPYVIFRIGQITNNIKYLRLNFPQSIWMFLMKCEGAQLALGPRALSSGIVVMTDHARPERDYFKTVCSMVALVVVPLKVVALCGMAADLVERVSQDQNVGLGEFLANPSGIIRHFAEAHPQWTSVNPVIISFVGIVLAVVLELLQLVGLLTTLGQGIVRLYKSPVEVRKQPQKDLVGTGDEMQVISEHVHIHYYGTGFK